ncbi:MAG: recombinase family protein [Syntrophobacteraceae bacterium]|jgi:site-specific DNA recombinase
MNKNRAVAHVRVSTSGQIDGESLNTQRATIQDYCTSRGWELVNVYEDAGISGTKDDRPALQALLLAAKAGEIDAVVVRDLSRFGRSARDLLNNIQTLKDCSVTFISIKEGIDGSGPYGQFMLTILAAIAELEMEMITSRMRENRLARWRDKRIFCGKPPYGYGWNSKKKRIEIVPDQGETYSRIVKEYLDLEKSLNDISIDLNAEAIPTRNSGRWSSGTLSRILKCGDYCGEITVNLYLTDATGKVIAHRPKSEHIVFEAPPLISKIRWDRLQERLDSANSRGGRPSNAAQEFLLHDLCRCGICGAKMRSDYGNRRVDGTRSRHYACYWHKAGPKTREIKGHQKCPLPLIPAELLEWQVFYVELMRQLGLEPEHYKHLLDAKHKWDSKIESLEKTLSNVNASKKRKEIALRNLDSLLESHGFDSSAYFQKRNGFLLEIKSLDNKLKDTQKDLEELRNRKSEEAEFAKLMSGTDPFKTLTYKIINLPFADKYRLLRGILDGPIVVGHSTLNPHVDPDPEDEMMKILEGIEMTVRHNHPLLLELLPE